MHVLTNAEKLIPLRDAASLAESRRLAGMRMVTGTTSPSTRYERISVSPASCSIKSEYVIASHAFKPQYKCINYTPAWEQRKLGEFGSVAMCKRIYKEQTSEQGDVPFFKIGTFGADPDAFISNELFEDCKRTYPYPTPGTLLISAAGSIGRIVEYQGEKAYFQDSNIVWLEHDHRLNDAFLKPLYSKIEWGLEGSTIKRLYNKDLLSAEVTIPDGREQKEIGQFFAKLDSLITLHQRKRQWLKWLDEGGEGTHHDIDILVFKFADDMKISVLCGVHACMTKSLGHTGNRYAGKQQQRGMGVP